MTDWIEFSLGPRAEIRAFLDAGMEPPVALVSEFFDRDPLYIQALSMFTKKLRVLTLKTEIDRAESAAGLRAAEIRAFLDAGMEPPEALVSEFIAVHVESECLYLEFLQAQDDLAETEEP